MSKDMKEMAKEIEADGGKVADVPDGLRVMSHIERQLVAVVLPPIGTLTAMSKDASPEGRMMVVYTPEGAFSLALELMGHAAMSERLQPLVVAATTAIDTAIEGMKPTDPAPPIGASCDGGGSENG